MPSLDEKEVGALVAGAERLVLDHVVGLRLVALRLPGLARLAKLRGVVQQFQSLELSTARLPDRIGHLGPAALQCTEVVELLTGRSATT